MGAVIAMASVSGQAQAIEPGAARALIASLQEMHEISRTMDDETRLRFLVELNIAVNGFNTLFRDYSALLQAMRAAGDCIPAHEFDAKPTVFPADLRCRD